MAERVGEEMGYLVPVPDSSLSIRMKVFSHSPWPPGTKAPRHLQEPIFSPIFGGASPGIPHLFHIHNTRVGSQSLEQWEKSFCPQVSKVFIDHRIGVKKASLRAR
jgi:hypothetical protein